MMFKHILRGITYLALAGLVAGCASTGAAVSTAATSSAQPTAVSPTGMTAPTVTPAVTGPGSPTAQPVETTGSDLEPITSDTFDQVESLLTLRGNGC